MEDAAILKAFLEVGILGLCAISLIITFRENNKRAHKKDDEKDARIDRKDLRNEDRTDILLNALKEQNEKYHDQIAEQFKIITSTIINGVVNHVPSPEETAKVSKVSERIDSCLQEILDDTNADRASLVQYHNGGRGINNQSFLKMSMTNEQTKANVKPIMMEFKDQFRGVLGYFVKELEDKGYCYIEDVDAIKDIDNGIYEFLKNRNVCSKFGIAIKNTNNMVIGFVCIEFSDKSVPNLDKIKKSFSQKQKVIEALLNL